MSRFLFARIGLIAACFAVPAKAPADLTVASSRKAAPDFTLNDALASMSAGEKMRVLDEKKK
jgi:hypothetical protein